MVNRTHIADLGLKKLMFINANISTTGRRTNLDLLLLTLPTLNLFSIDFIGQLFVGEIVLAGIGIFVLIFAKSGDNKISTIHFLVFICAWFCAQAITDLIRDTPSGDLLRGWAKIIFFGLSLLALTKLIISVRGVLCWTIGSTIPLIWRPFQLFGADYDVSIAWKFGLGFGILLTAMAPILVLARYNERSNNYYRALGWLQLIFGFSSFMLNARSFAAMTIITGLITLLFSRRRGAYLRSQSMSYATVAALAIAYLLATFYSWGAESGYLGTDAYDKYEMQNKAGGGPLSILLGGRSEILVSTNAIVDSPLIGHGSWARDPYYASMLSEMRRMMLEVDETPTSADESDLIPTHSYIFGAWVEAGLVGGLFWLYVTYWLIAYLVPAAWQRGDVLGYICIFQVPTLVWNIFFSPFGANVRVEVAALLVIFSLALRAPYARRVINEN